MNDVREAKIKDRKLMIMLDQLHQKAPYLRTDKSDELSSDRAEEKFIFCGCITVFFCISHYVSIHSKLSKYLQYARICHIRKN